MTLRNGNVRHVSRLRRKTPLRFTRLSREEANHLHALTMTARRLKPVHPKEDMHATRRMIAFLRQSWARTLDRDELLERIKSSPSVCNGQPVVYGTKIRVWAILDALIDNKLEEVFRRYPVLSYNDVRAAVAFACEVLKAEFDYEEEGQETNPKGDVED